MDDIKVTRVVRPATPEEQARHTDIREKVTAEFPPAATPRVEPPPGLPARIHAARERQGLTWFALAKRAGLPDSGIVRNIESGRDAPLSSVEAVARALGLRLELVEAAS